MDNKDHTRRRQFLKATGGLSGLSLLAGCSGDGSDDGSGDGSSNGGGDSSDGGSNDQIQLPEEIEWTIYTSPGGGFDSYSRAIAPVFQEQLAEYGVESVTPNNRTGAGGQIALNHIYNADPDGSFIGIWNHAGHIVAQVTEGTEYDLREMTHIGQVAASKRGIAIPNRLTSDIESYQDFIDYSKSEGPLQVGTTGEGAGSWVANKVLNSVDEINAEQVLGYEGAKEYVTAVIRGDLDYAQVTVGTLDEFLVSPGEGEPVVVLGGERADVWPDTPTRTEAGFSPTIYPALNLNRIVSGPPGMPEEIAEVMSDALVAAIESDEVQEWADNADRPLTPVPRGEELNDIIDNGFQMVEEYSDIF